MHHIYLTALTIVLLALIAAPAFAAPTTTMPAEVLISEHGSERSTTGPGNNIVTHKGKTHVVWQECNERGYYDVVRTLDRATGEWGKIVTIGPGKDNHARPCIAVDSKGFLHVVIGGHGTMMNYYKSKAANDSSKWERAVPVDIGTYPMLICGAEDTLVLGARHDPSVRGVDIYVKQGEGKWQKRDYVFTRLKRNTGYSGYNVALAWGPDGKRLHLAADVYESGTQTPQRGCYQAMVYMVSDDLGLTWKKADGTPIVEKPTSDKLDMIAVVDVGMNAKNPPIATRNGGLVVDKNDRPYIYWMHRVDGVARMRLSTPDEKGQWQDLPIQNAFTKAWPGVGFGGFRGSLSMTDDGVMHAVVDLDRTPAATQPDDNDDADDDNGSTNPPPKKPVDRHSASFHGFNYGIGLLSSRDGGKSFTAQTLLVHDPKRMVGLTNIERQTGHNDMTGRLPSLIYTDGLQRYPTKQVKDGKQVMEVINTKVFWMQPR